MEDKIKLNIVGLTSSHSQRNSYTLILGEDNGELKLPVIIGGYEAQSIALVIEGLKPQRPLTHDLIQDFLNQYQIVLKEVIINKLEEGVFYSTLVTSMNGKEIHIDARTSDAVAIALRSKCNIYTFRSILNDAGIQYEDDDENSLDSDTQEIEQIPEPNDTLGHLSLDQLKLELDKAIQIEDYKRAALIRDKIKSLDS